jgi:hypothetical protein
MPYMSFQSCQFDARRIFCAAKHTYTHTFSQTITDVPTQTRPTRTHRTAREGKGGERTGAGRECMRVHLSGLGFRV